MGAHLPFLGCTSIDIADMYVEMSELILSV